MFHPIPPRIHERMRQLEVLDGADRAAGTPRLERLRQIPPDTGRFLALLAASAPPGELVEIGTSAGYSALWLSLACLETDRRLTTYEVLPEKARLARETFALAEVTDVVTLVEGDAREWLGAAAGSNSAFRTDPAPDIAFCFLDAEKEVYDDCYTLLVPRLVPGGLLVADNVLSHAEELASFVERAMTDDRVDALVVPIGKGELVCRRRADATKGDAGAPSPGEA